MSEFDLAGFSKAIADHAEKAAPLTASITVGRHHSASAFHWGDGLYVAAEEAIDEDADLEAALASGETVKAELLGADASTGIAVLRPATASVPAPFSRAADIRAGELTVVVGRAGTAPIVGFGVVSEAGPAWTSMRGGKIDRRINLGLSLDERFEGAAALDVAGSLVGMVLFGPRRRPLVIPAATIDRVAPVLAEKRRVARGYLGAGLHTVKEAGVHGAMVMSLDQDGPARRAGLHLGDIVTHWNGEPVVDPREIARRLGSDSVGATVKLSILRGGSTQIVDLVIGERPEA